MHVRTIARNIFSTWTGYFVTIATGFFLAPYVVHHLGNTAYGVWTLIVSLTGYFGMLDLGLRQSVGRFLARHIALDDPENVNRSMSTAAIMLGLGGILALLATAIMNASFGIFHVTRQLEFSARTALLIAGLNISLALPMSVFAALLASLERFDLITSITFVGTLARTTLVVILLRSGQGLVALALIMLLESVAEYFAMAVCAKRLYRPLSLGWEWCDVDRGKELFSFGIFRFVWIMSNQLIFYADSVVIGVVLNVGAITYYAIAGSLVNYGRNIISLAIETLYPMANRLDAQKDFRGLQNLQVFGTRIALIVGLPLCIGFMLLGRQFISLWMGPAYSSSALILIVLTIPQFMSLSQYISAVILVGMAKHKVLAGIALAEALANLTLSIVFARKFGVIGVAWGTVITHTITSAIVIPLYTLWTLRMGLTEYLTRAFLAPVGCGIPIAGFCYALSRLEPNPSWLIFAVEVAAIAVMSMALNYVFSLTASQQASVRNKIEELIPRSAVTSDMESKVRSLWRTRGLWGLLSGAGSTLISFVFRRRARLIWEARFTTPPLPSEWADGERLLVLGADNIDREMTSSMRLFLGGDEVADSIAGVRAGDLLFVLTNETEYLACSYIFFDKTQSTRKQAVIFGEENVPIIGMSYTLPSARGRGIYRRALHEMFRFLSNMGYERAICEVNPQNAPSNKASQAAGMQLCRELTDWAVLNHLFLQKVQESGKSRWRIFWA